MKFMAMVGSEIFWNGIGSTFSGEQSGITDVNIGNTGNGNDGTDACFLDFHFVQTVKLVQLADLHLADACQGRGG